MDTTVKQQRRTVAVHSPSGGVGTTTIAANVATVVARQRPDRVALVDLHLQFGQVATHLNLNIKQSIADLARDEAAMREPELLKTYATRHNSGLHVFAAPTSPEQAELITAEHVDRILTTLLEAYESVVIDTGSWLDERTMTAFEHSETVILVACPEIGALKALRGAPRVPQRSGLGRREVDVRAEQPVRPRDPQAARRRNGPRHARSRRSSPTTRSSISRRSTRASTIVGERLH